MKKIYKRMFSLSSIVLCIACAVLITAGIGYFTGHRLYLVNGWSSEPEIKYKSLVMDKTISYSELYEDFLEGQVEGKAVYITFSKSGNAYTTHSIVAMKPEGEYFEVGEEVTFQNMGITFKRKVKSKCQIITMTNNSNSYASFLKPYLEDPSTQPAGESGPGHEELMFSNVKGKVISVYEKLGQFLFYVRFNFLQIVTYVIIFYIANEIFRFVPDYIKLF